MCVSKYHMWKAWSYYGGAEVVGPLQSEFSER
jgi:hypothetical protein